MYGENDRIRAWVGGMQWRHLETTIGLERRGELVAAAGYTDYIEGASVAGHVVIRGPVTRAFIHALLWYPFEQLGVQRLSGLVPASNVRVKRFMEHLGMRYETTLERMLPEDLEVYRIFKEECPWVKVQAPPPKP